MTHKRPRINFRQDRNPELFEIFLSHLLRAPVRTDFRELAHDQAFDIGPRGFVVFRIGAVISDFRIGENYNLAAVRRVSENFLVASYGSIKNDFARTFAFGAVAFAAEDAPVFQRKDSLHQCSREWILEILAQVQNRDGRTSADVLHADKIAGVGARATHYSLRASCGTTCSSSFSVQPSTVIELLTPTWASVSKRCRSSTPATALPSRATITSPSRNPARWAGLPGVTADTITPLSWRRS